MRQGGAPSANLPHPAPQTRSCRMFAAPVIPPGPVQRPHVPRPPYRCTVGVGGGRVGLGRGFQSTRKNAWIVAVTWTSSSSPRHSAGSEGSAWSSGGLGRERPGDGGSASGEHFALLKRVPLTARTRTRLVLTAPKRGSSLRVIDLEILVSHTTQPTKHPPPQPTPQKFENTFVIWIQRPFPLSPLLQTRSILPPRAAVVVHSHSGVSGVRF